MSETSERKRGYAVGYYAGCRRSDRELELQRRRADNAAQRAERAERAAGLGHCEDCAHWTRGCANCTWGYCGVEREAGSPYGCWIQDSESQKRRLITTPRFGCVLFIARIEPSQTKVEG